MPSSPVRVAVIGLGAWGTLAHLPALARRPDAALTAVVDSDPRRVHDAAQRYAVPLGPISADELWDRADAFDAVVIATPTDTHCALALRAIALGKHVLCEKPLAFDVGQAEVMADAATSAGVVTKLGFMFRCSPAIARMKALIDEGYVGDIVAFQSHTMNAQFVDPTTPIHWKMRRDRANGGVAVEYGAHAIDLAHWLVGPIGRVIAQAATITAERPDGSDRPVPVDVEDVASWLVEFTGGAQGSFETSWSTLPVGGGGVRVYGTRGSLAWQPDPTLRESERLIGATVDAPDPAVLLEYRTRFLAADDDQSIGIAADYNDRLVDSFIADVRRGRSSGPEFGAGLRAQQVLAALQTSLGSGQWASVDHG